MAAKFGTSGLRGLIEELTDGTAARHAGAFAAALIASGRCQPGAPLFIGRDLRSSSPLLARQCLQAVAAEGLLPIDCGAVPTPALALHAMACGAGSIMVTGSHIPDDRNGVKFYRPDGEIDKTDETAIAEGAKTRSGAPAGPLPELSADISAAVLAGYRARYRGLLADGALAGWRIGVYEHSTVLRDVLADILSDAGAEVVRLGRSEAFIPVDTEAVTDAVQAEIRAWVAAHKLDALASADGDGDRPLLADETGRCLRGDLLGLLTARWLGADAAATPITSNSGIEAHIAGQVWRSKVGSPHVIAAMEAAKAGGAAGVVGFEANGGTLTASRFRVGGAALEPLPTRDSTLPILAALASARGAGLSLSALAASLALPVAESGLIRALPTEESQALIARLTADAPERAAFMAPFGAVASVDLTDGLRMTLVSGAILHLRPSGNAPEMRVYVEAADAEAAAALVSGAVARVLAATGRG
jgi:phosphomannomutase